MRNLMLFGLILLILALNCEAVAPLQLSGSNGKTILENIANNTTNRTLANATLGLPGDLWSWGKIPIGHSINRTGMLIENIPSEFESLVVLPPQISR